VLINELEIPVRFNEADPLGVVWHGHYLRYFEDGREAFGKDYAISYLDFYRNNIAVPVVSVQCDYKRPLHYGDTLLLKTIFQPVPAAKLLFRYEIYHADRKDLIATGNTTQVFVDAKSFELHLIVPEFFQQWRDKWHV